MKRRVLSMLALTLAGCRAVPLKAPLRAEQRYFRYSRNLKMDEVRPSAASDAPLACAALDAAVFEHARPSLADLRLYAGTAEVPYAPTISEASAAMPDKAQVLNLGERNGVIEFDLAMPRRPYSEIDLDLDQTNFLAAAKVTGLRAAEDRSGPLLGTFTLFDLQDQRLSRSTALQLAESTFPFVRVELGVRAVPGGPAVKASPAIVRGAIVPPSREAQTLYTTVAETTSLTAQERGTSAEFDVPANVPVERVDFTLAPGYDANFSRTVSLVATPNGKDSDGSRPLEDRVSGEISRVRMPTSGQPIRTEKLGFPATLGTSNRAGTHIRVTVENGDDRPLALHSVRLQMRERKLCFDVPEARPMQLFYGDGELGLPTYDYARTFNASDPSRKAELAAEEPNPLFTPRAQEKGPFTERHPELLWVGLLAMVAVLGVVAFRSAKGLPR